MSAAGAIFAQAEGVLTFMTRALEVQYTGGTPFFDALDSSLRDPYLVPSALAALLRLLPDEASSSRQRSVRYRVRRVAGRE